MGNLIAPDPQYFAQMMKNKFPAGSKYHTGWIVSNCNSTIGAKNRLESDIKNVNENIKNR